MTTLTFPQDFRFGAATAAFQIEGGHEDGRGDSIWDVMCREPNRVQGAEDGQIACDHYHRMPSDVALMKSLNLETYRFSTSWARVMPDGKTVNPQGIDFYSRLVDELLAADIKPWLTLYHWDLPAALEGGWTNRETSYRFADYASAMIEALGDRVDVWTTLNEPWCSSLLSYASGEHAPGHRDPREAVSAVHHLLLAHGLGIQALRAARPQATLGITTNHTVAHPADPENPGDVEAARRIDGAQNRIFLDPIFKGEYPADVLEDMAEAGLGAAAHDGDLEIISQPIDVLGVNFYNGTGVAAPEDGVWADPLDNPTLHQGPGGGLVASPFVGSERVRFVPRNLPVTAMGWEIGPDDLRILLERLSADYTGPAGIPIVITENGAAFEDRPDEEGFVDDLADRGAYIKAHLGAVNQAMENGVNVAGYLAWSLMDNFEWAWGYAKRFGIVRVDYETQQRTVKGSGRWYGEVARTHTIEM